MTHSNTMPVEYYEPTPDQRRYYRDSQTGDRGYFVVREGRDMIRLDRPMEERLYPVSDRWEREHDYRPLTPAQIAQVAFTADKELCRFLGLHEDARKDWSMQPERERIRFMHHGPVATGVRLEMFHSIVSLLTGVERWLTGVER